MFEKMIREQTAKQAEQLEAWLSKRESEQTFPDDVELIENIDYMGDGEKSHMLDIYRPKNASGVRPALINIHGGGFLLGSKEVNRLFCADMCRRGFVVACLEYPLVPSVTVFDILRDLSAGVDFVSEHACEYGGMSGSVYLSGDSAGAWLCVYLAAIANSDKIAEAASVRAPKADICALGLISGMFYTRKLDNVGIFLPRYIYGAGWRKSRFRPYMDPENELLLKSLPPAFVVTADGDFLRHYSREFSAALEKTGADMEFMDISAEEKLPHAFAAMLPEKPESQRANERMADFMLKR